MKSEIIKVDYLDQEIGTAEKMDLHISHILHRAFSVFIFHNSKMLIQQRNSSKYHSGGLWTNACCSHIYRGAQELECVKKRLQEELGIEASPRYLTKFVYYHKFNNDMYEFEYDHIYLLDYCGPFNINQEEIHAIEWVDIDFLANDILENPEKYTVWFITAFGIVYKYLHEEKMV